MTSSTAEGQSQAAEPPIQVLRQRVLQLVDTVHTAQRRCDELSRQEAAWRSEQQALHEQLTALTQERDQLRCHSAPSFINPENSKIAFLHIRKTAGTSFIENLCEALPSDSANSICPIRSQIELECIIPSLEERSELLKSYNLILGHFHSLSRYVDINDYLIAMIFRDPVARTISAFNQIVNDTTDPFHQHAVGLSLDDALQSEDLDYELSNSQFRYLSGNLGSCDLPLELDDHEAIEKYVCKCLKRVNYLGITELYSSSLSLFRHTSKGGLNFSSPKQSNTEITKSGVKLHNLEEKTISLIIEKNKLDMQVYMLALKEFDLRLAKSIY